MLDTGQERPHGVKARRGDSEGPAAGGFRKAEPGNTLPSPFTHLLPSSHFTQQEKRACARPSIELSFQPAGQPQLRARHISQCSLTEAREHLSC